MIDPNKPIEFTTGEAAYIVRYDEEDKITPYLVRHLDGNTLWHRANGECNIKDVWIRNVPEPAAQPLYDRLVKLAESVPTTLPRPVPLWRSCGRWIRIWSRRGSWHPRMPNWSRTIIFQNGPSASSQGNVTITFGLACRSPSPPSSVAANWRRRAMGDGIRVALVTILALFALALAHSMGESKGRIAGWNAACEAFGPQDDLNNCPTAFIGEMR